MRRGQERSDTGDRNSLRFSKREMMEVGNVSAKVFDSIRKAARVRGPGHGGLDWAFDVNDVRSLIHRAESGSFTERGAAPAAAWRTMLAEAGVSIDWAPPPS